MLKNSGDWRTCHTGSTMDGGAGDGLRDSRMAIAASFLQVGRIYGRRRVNMRQDAMCSMARRTIGYG